ncbi:SPL family radical SAM protein [Fischerella thermalis]|jgi:DNA repair photolyase|uniref:Radical SAM domain protein n=3 Tax=Fischerella TaxID=1190 RepID=G6FQ05_9CYAN|nr:radical SAM protein [Fischerella thermalis]PMB50518.1 radical SAM protein [Fischerella thermalis CCMEE 5205]PMB52826.1 radical SAM protein [Fischerella thermalis CCMEE 5201]EHC17890.1 Radical SAM domain protein [Fischerella thermalis JSC-11]PLZ06801.1 radical SAM protein [Fischerella thermalis WC119]PLZ07510.1 radical SAM protein [Fischerella thermalis WC114]
MAKSQYQGYCELTPTKLVQEKFGDINIYAQNSKSLLTKATGFIAAYDFTLNPYRGCQYGCSYCYAAAFSPNTKMRLDWGKWVIFKENASLILEKELESWYRKNPKQSPKIYMSSVTDPYQPLESKYQLTRNLLGVMLDFYPTPTLVIQTRSPIITRDIDYLQRFQRLRINMSIPTGSELVRRDFEPRSPSIKARFNALKKIKQNIDQFKGFIPKISVTITPLLPTLPDEEDIFIEQLRFADRIVIQDFHPSQNNSLVASTRQEAEEIKRKYAWWYENEKVSYITFKQKLVSRLPEQEIKEGKDGFGYE